MRLLLVVVLGCGHRLPCPPGSAPDRDRAAAVAGLLGRPDIGPACFGDRREPGLRPDGVLLLDAGWSDERLAARVAHLLVHRDRPAASEAEARAVEAAWRDRLLRRELAP